MVNILFVCTGNICRSPMAEGIFKHLMQINRQNHLFYVDSCGTSGVHSGQNIDRRALEVLRGHGISIKAHSARQVQKQSDFVVYNHILTMDKGHQAFMQRLGGKSHQHKIQLLLSILEKEVLGDVSDPYYGTLADFNKLYGVILEACQAWFRKLSE